MCPRALVGFIYVLVQDISIVMYIQCSIYIYIYMQGFFQPMLTAAHCTLSKVAPAVMTVKSFELFYVYPAPILSLL
jgi:hypothetical protein